MAGVQRYSEEQGVMLCFRPQVQGQEHRTARNSPDMSKSVSSGKALPKTPLKI